MRQASMNLKLVCLLFAGSLLMYRESWTQPMAGKVHSLKSLVRGAQTSRCDIVRAQGADRKQQPSPAAIHPIPNIIHFVMTAREPDLAPSMTFVQMLAILSAAVANEPEALYVHATFQPWGQWWDVVAPWVTLRLVQPPKAWGSKPIINQAHVSDHIRIHVLLEMGGVYLDSDVITVRSFAPLRATGTTMIMGREGDIGLCNAVIMAAPGAEFLKTWRERYESVFVPEGWGEASVQYPLKLSRELPHAITVLPETAFFWPSWRGSADSIFRDPNQQVRSDAYAHHLWGGVTKVPLQGYRDTTSIWPARPVPSNLFEKVIRHLATEYPKWNCSISKAARLRDGAVA